MALLTDSEIITLQHLRALDAEIADVAAAEELVIEGDTGLIRQALEECIDLLFERMQAFGGDFYDSSRSRVVTLAGASQIASPSQVVATDGLRKSSVVERLLTYHTLMLCYRAAANRTVSDRYVKKLAQFTADRITHFRSLLARGLPVVSQPLPCPGSLLERNTGTWDLSNLSAVSGGSAEATTYHVAITWVDGSRYVSTANKGNAESGPSRTLAYTIPLNQRLSVSISSLVPPVSAGYRQSPGGPLVPYLNATGWNLYVGLPDGPLYLQNVAPVALNSAYTLTGAPALTGAVLDPGQVPDVFFRLHSTLQRT